MTELEKRTISGAVFVGCVVGSILWSEVAFSVLFAVIAVLAVDEYHRLVQSSGKLRIMAGVGTLFLWCMMQCLAWHGEEGESYLAFGMTFGFAHVAVICIALLDEIWNHSGQPLQNWGNLFISQLMIAAPLSMLLLLYSLDKWLLLALFVIIWTNDTGAYCVGSLTAKRAKGNHKMAPHVSPKKSWEGLVGGVGFAIIAGLILRQCGWFDVITASSFGLLVAAIFALLVSTFGTMGDLMESLFKRAIGVKDSGKFLPGHGGVLDRFDSVLLASPIITAFCWLCYFAVPLL